MDNIFLIRSDKEKTINSSGLLPVIAYEPWAGRTIESIKHSISDGNPVLIRLHSAADYPCNNSELAYKLDLESHAILLVGYDDDKQEFDVVNPWNKLWGGQYGGLEKISYDIIPITCVNASLGKTTVLALPYKKVNAIVDENRNSSVSLSLGYYLPKGYIIDEKADTITDIRLELIYTINDEVRKYNQHICGRWTVGDNIETEIPLNMSVIGDLRAEFKVNLTVEGARPYPYQDIITFEFEEELFFLQEFLSNENRNIELKAVNY